MQTTCSMMNLGAGQPFIFECSITFAYITCSITGCCLFLYTTIRRRSFGRMDCFLFSTPFAILGLTDLHAEQSLSISGPADFLNTDTKPPMLSSMVMGWYIKSDRYELTHRNVSLTMLHGGVYVISSIKLCHSNLLKTNRIHHTAAIRWGNL